MQCVVESEDLGEFLPGWYLGRATINSDADWPKGNLALIQCNDPTYVLTDIDPNKDYEGEDLIYLIECFYGRPKEGWELLEAAKKKGYKPKVHGHLELWIVKRIKKYLKEIQKQ